MLSDIENARKMIELLGDEGFVNALTNAENLVNEVDQTLDRVEQIEGDAEQAVREANEALTAVDNRLQKFDEAIRLIEAKIEAGFSIGFFFFALQQWTAGEPLIAAGLFAMGLLGVSSLAVTVATMPQVQRLRQLGRYLSAKIEEDADESGGRGAGGADDRSAEPKLGEPRVDWETVDSQGDRRQRDRRRDDGSDSGRRRS